MKERKTYVINIKYQAIKKRFFREAKIDWRERLIYIVASSKEEAISLANLKKKNVYDAKIIKIEDHILLMYKHDNFGVREESLKVCDNGDIYVDKKLIVSNKELVKILDLYFLFRYTKNL